MTQWYYARGGSQHGPVALEELRGLIRTGIVDPATDLVWNTSMKDWLPASQVPELSAAPPADPENPYSAPASTWDAPEMRTPDGPLAEIAPGSDPIDPMECVKRGFELTVRHFGMILLVGLVYFAVYIGFTFLLGLVGTLTGMEPTPAFEVRQAGEVVQSGGNPIWIVFSNLISQVFSVFLSLGLARIGLNIVSGHPFSVGMLFAGGHKLVRGVLATLLYSLMVIVGLILLIVPGIYVMLRFGQYLNAIVDRDLGVIDSLKYSSTITTNCRLNLFLLTLLSIAIVLAGCLALGVGIIFAWPVVSLSWFAAYRWMQYGRQAMMDHPGTKQPLLAGPIA